MKGWPLSDTTMFTSLLNQIRNDLLSLDGNPLVFGKLLSDFAHSEVWRWSWPNDSSCADCRAGMSVEMGRRVRVTESMCDTSAPAVGTSALFALVRSWLVVRLMST